MCVADGAGVVTILGAGAGLGLGAMERLSLTGVETNFLLRGREAGVKLVLAANEMLVRWASSFSTAVNFLLAEGRAFALENCARSASMREVKVGRDGV